MGISRFFKKFEPALRRYTRGSRSGSGRRHGYYDRHSGSSHSGGRRHYGRRSHSSSGGGRRRSWS